LIGVAVIQLDLMTRWTGSTENLHISFDQTSEKAAEWALWFEVSFGIFLKSLYTAWRTKVIRLALIHADQGVRISPGDLHPAYRVHKFFLGANRHNLVLHVATLLTPWERYKAARERKGFQFLKWAIAV